MGALEGRQRWKGMSANSIIILRGLNMADCHACDKGALCCWATLELGREEMNDSVSVFGSLEPRQCVYTWLYVYRCMHGSICYGCTFFTIRSHALLCSSALNSSPQSITTGTSKCVSFPPEVYCVCVGFRYPPSSRQTSHEEGKEWLRSHSTGGLQDTGSQSPLSPPGASCTTTGKYHYSNLCKCKVGLVEVGPVCHNQPAIWSELACQMFLVEENIHYNYLYLLDKYRVYIIHLHFWLLMTLNSLNHVFKFLN